MPSLHEDKVEDRSACARVPVDYPAGIARRALLRRELLRTAFSASIGLMVPCAAAQQKMSQAEAEYQDGPKGGLTCAACTLFRPPRSCQIVQGDISPRGWCKFFDLPD